MMRNRTPSLLLLLLVLLVPACAKQDEAETAEKTETDTTSVPGRIELAPEAMRSGGIALGTAGPATIDVILQLPGQVAADSTHVQVVRPRFAGIVHALRKQIGDPVHRGETIASIQSNESLTDYAVTSAQSGRVVTRGASVGEAVTVDTPIYTIVDLSTVWVEFAIYPHQLGQVHTGQSVRIAPAGGADIVNGRISYVGPVLAQDTRSSSGRIVVSNRGGRWEPGMLVTVSVITDHAQVPVAVPDDAIVRTAEGPAVFVTDGANAFRIRAVATGRTDGHTTQITSGLAAGDTIAIRNAFVLKAELEKAEFEE